MTTTVDHTSLHVASAALVVVDVQADFVDGAAPTTDELGEQLVSL